jgi:GNAT superfamily N-acetyltransferase
VNRARGKFFRERSRIFPIELSFEKRASIIESALSRLSAFTKERKIENTAMNDPALHATCYLYPEREIELIHRCELRDRTNVHFHFIREGCDRCLALGLEKLSPDSRRFRFNHSIARFSKKELEYLTRIDNKNHTAIGAALFDDKEFPGIGIGRYIRLPGSDIAEIALTVIDRYQNKGLASILFALLARHAKRNHITRFVGFANLGNSPVARLMDKFGFDKAVRDQGMLRRELDIASCDRIISSVLDEANAVTNPK